VQDLIYELNHNNRRETDPTSMTGQKSQFRVMIPVPLPEIKNHVMGKRRGKKKPKPAKGGGRSLPRKNCLEKPKPSDVQIRPFPNIVWGPRKKKKGKRSSGWGRTLGKVKTERGIVHRDDSKRMGEEICGACRKKIPMSFTEKGQVYGKRTGHS